jgi:aldehyde:ferredoxin oxidoreductase
VENIYFQDPAPGTYTLKVCGFDICDSGSTTAVTAQMIEGGVITWQQQINVSEWDDNCVEVYTKTVD